MAKYVKTEEGYKTLNEVDGIISLRGENYIEVKDDIVRTTFGDAIKIEEEDFVKEYCNSLISTMEYNPSFGGYATPYTGTCTPVLPPQNGEFLEIEIATYSGAVLFKGSAVYKGSSTGGRAESQDGLTIIFSNQYASLGAANIILVYPTNVSGHSLKIVGKQKKLVDGYVTLPKTALNYDDEPTENSDNLLTSGIIYTTVQNLKDQISASDGTQQGIIDITEDTYIYNLESGVYYINSEGEYNLYISDSQEYPFHNGIVFVSKSEGSVSWTMFGYDDSWYGIARTGHTNYNHTTGEWGIDYAYSGDFENQTNKVNSIDKTSTNAQYPTAKAVYDYIDNTIENIKKYTYSVENLGNKYVSGASLKYLDLTTTVGEDTSTSPSQWYLACDIEVALAKYENGKITNLVNHPFNISYEDDGRLKINDIDNASEAAIMIGTPKFINTYSSIAEEMVDGSIFTQSSRHSMSTWIGEAYGTQAIGVQLRLNIFSPTKAAIEGLKAEFDGIIAKTTHAVIYYHHNPFIIGG